MRFQAGAKTRDSATASCPRARCGQGRTKARREFPTVPRTARTSRRVYRGDTCGHSWSSRFPSEDIRVISNGVRNLAFPERDFSQQRLEMTLYFEMRISGARG